jgi:hypothetical protein
VGASYLAELRQFHGNKGDVSIKRKKGIKIQKRIPY